MKFEEAAALGGAALGFGLLLTVNKFPPSMPSLTIPFVDMPISLDLSGGVLNERIVGDFVLITAPAGIGGVGRLSILDGNLLYENLSGFTMLATRTKNLQHKVGMRFIWKALSGDGFVNEGWNGLASYVGNGAQIVFQSGKAWFFTDPNPNHNIELMSLDPAADWNTVEIHADYDVPEISSVSINGETFTDLRMGNNPITGSDLPYWQLQLAAFLGPAKILIQSIEAWEE